MEGLEITIQNFKTLESIIDYRVEAEYFDKRFLQTDELFAKNQNVLFFNVADYENGRAYNSEEFSESFIENGIKISKIGDVTQKRLNENWVWVSPEEFEKQKGRHLIEDDILMTLTGDPPDVGKVNIFKQNEINSTWNQRVARIFLKDNQTEFYSRQVLFVVLSNRYCREQLERYAKGIRQRNLGTECIEKLKLPVLQEKFQILLDSLVSVSFEKSKYSHSLYHQAETLLLETLGLKDFQPSSEAVNIKSFKESFGSSGRLDAEYYQKKYEGYAKLIKNYKHGFNLIKNICNLKDSNFNPDKTKEYQYIELSDIGNAGNIMSCTIAKGDELPSRARRIVQANDVIISSIEGSLESCALVSEEYNNSLCSTGFYVVNSNRINSETLLVLFKSELMQNILKQNCSGTILTAINKTEFQNIPVPLVKVDVQKQIKEKISASFRLKQESEQLLETAKRAVEIAIEEDEETAIKYINQST